MFLFCSAFSLTHLYLVEECCMELTVQEIHTDNSEL